MGGAKGMQESTIVKTKEQTMKNLLKKSMMIYSHLKLLTVS